MGSATEPDPVPESLFTGVFEVLDCAGVTISTARPGLTSEAGPGEAVPAAGSLFAALAEASTGRGMMGTGGREALRVLEISGFLLKIPPIVPGRNA